LLGEGELNLHMAKPPKDRSAGDSHDPYSPLEKIIPEKELEKLSTLQILDLIAARMPDSFQNPHDFHLLRTRVEEMEEIQDQARTAIEKLGDAVDKLRAPALRLGTLLEVLGKHRALVCVNGTDYMCNVDPTLPSKNLETGSRVLLNEAFAVVDSFGFNDQGPIVRVLELMSDGRIRVGQEAGVTDMVVIRSSLLAKEKIKAGMDIRLDPNNRVAIEIIGVSKRLDRSLAKVDPIPWSSIGGQHDAVEMIREAIEWPYLHPHLFKKFKHPLPKGFLLYGPPGCGKTLLAKAAAYNLKEQISKMTGEPHSEFFLSVKGPEILNMWLGESERQVRDLFAQCREKANEGHLAFLFIDEAESILGTRSSQRSGSNILSTLVPMFCAEMDGLESLKNVVVILASNRADLIDPAILRPGRIDRKIRVRRPDKESARQIYKIYLTEDLPLSQKRDDLVEIVLEAHYAPTESNRFLEVTYRSGKKQFLHKGDLASGALIAGIVERAKELAIKRSIAEGHDCPLTADDLLHAFEQEYKENELFPPTDLTEDWLKLTDFEPSNVVQLAPIRQMNNQTQNRVI